MNRHFEDATYHARRAAEEAATGLREELELLEERVLELAGRETEPEPTPRERVRSRAGDVEERARERVRDVRRRVR